MHKPKLIMLVGLPGAGKSHYAKQLEDQGYIIHSFDDVKTELGYDDHSKNDKVYHELHRRIKYDLKSGNSVVYNATNIKYKWRKGFLTELNNIDCEKICHWVYLPYDQCLQVNASRYQSVPAKEITQMYLNFYVPYYYEGWDDIRIIGDTQNRSGRYEIETLLSYNQHNPNHRLTLGEHLIYSAVNMEELAKNRDDKKLLSEAAQLHDIGKPFTKCFTNLKGMPTKEAHYYNHSSCGAYDSVEYNIFGCEDTLTRAALIMWHMQPHAWEKNQDNKQRLKYLKLWGDDFYDQILLLHEADLKAH